MPSRRVENDQADFDKDNPARKGARATAKALNFGVVFGRGAGAHDVSIT
jgi:hypothetical protein